jgi:ABC-2 type transport system permease protein
LRSVLRTAVVSAVFFLRLERYAPSRLALTVFFQPSLMALYTCVMATQKGAAAVIHVAIGSALASLWGSLIGTATYALARERVLGTVDYVVGSPAALGGVITGVLAADGVSNALALIPTFTVAWLLDPAVRSLNGLAVLGAAFVAVWGVVALGYCVAPVVALRRQLSLWINAFETPFWLLGGLLFPVALLPHWVQGIAAVTSIYWVAGALNAVASHPGRGLLVDGLWLCGLSGAYAVIGARVLRVVIQRLLRQGDWSAV